jgi:predicted DNA-binding transcriptional regulator YafY
MRDSEPLRRQWILTQIISTRLMGATVRELAQELEFSEKTIRRDLETLRNSGFPIEEAREDYGRKRWRLHGGSFNPPRLNFNLEEVAALYLGRRFLEPLAGTMFWQGAQKAFSKVRSFLGDNALRHLEKMAAAWHQTTIGNCDYSKQAELIDDLMVAIEDRLIAFITYQSARSTEPVTYEVYPYGLVWHRGSLYLIAFSRHHDEIRNFKLDRLTEVATETLKFQKPADFNLQDHLKDSLGIFHTTGEPKTVRIRFAATVARYVQEHHWHASQKLRPQKDGSLILELQLASLEEVKSWIQSFGPNAIVLEPEELREEVIAELEANLLVYQREEKE